MVLSTTLASAEDGRATRALASSRPVATGAVLLALACALGLLEASLPPLPVTPWLRFGFSNIAVVVALALGGASMAAVVGIGRVVLVSLATGAIFTPVFAMAATGAAFSVTTMWVVSRVPGLSPVGWSSAGSAAHVIGQFLAAALLLGSPGVVVLAPPSVALAVVFGAIVGSLARSIISRVQNEWTRERGRGETTPR